MISTSIQCCLATALLLAAVLYGDTTTLRNLTYDEVNYLLAARQPFIETWASTNTLTIMEFFYLALEKLGVESELNGVVVSEDYDNFYLRHFHGHLFIYPLVAISHLGLDPEETVWIARILSFALLIFSIVFYVYIKEPKRERRLIQIIFCLLVILITPGLNGTGAAYNVHILLATLVLFSIPVVEMTVRHPEKNYLVISLGAMTACLIATTITALVVVSIFYYFVFSNLRKTSVSRIAFLSIIGFFLAQLLVNPGFFYSFDVVKSFFMYLYRIIFIQSEYTQLHIGLSSLLGSYASIVLLGVAIILYKGFLLKGNLIEMRDWLITYFSKNSLELLLFFGYGLFLIPFIVNHTYFLLPSVLFLLLLARPFSTILLQRTSKISFLLFVGLILTGKSFIHLNDNYWNRKVESFEKGALPSRERTFQKVSEICRAEGDEGKVLFSFDANEVRLYAGTCSKVIPLIIDYDGTTLLFRTLRSWENFSSFDKRSALIIMKDIRYRELEALKQIPSSRVSEISPNWSIVDFGSTNP